MNLKSLARCIEHLGKDLLVIEDDALLAWSGQRGVQPWEAQVAALEEEIIPHRYLKNFWSIGFAEQARLCGSRVLICGCGGLGGILVELVSRCGIGRVRFIDMDVFAQSNLNRQLLSSPGNLEKSKVQAAVERIRTINPLTAAEPFGEKLEESNAVQLLDGVDLVLDALDNIEGRIVLASTAHRLGIPFIHAAVAGWWGQISTFLPDSAIGLSSIYGSRRKKDRAEEAAGVPGPTPAIIGSLSALEAVRILTGKPAAYSGQMLYFDGESGTFTMLPLC